MKSQLEMEDKNKGSHSSDEPSSFVESSSTISQNINSHKSDTISA
jgi:hypothetical protein